MRAVRPLLFALAACRGETIKSEGTQAAPWRPLLEGAALSSWKETPFGGGGRVEIAEGRIDLGQGSPMTGVTWSGSVAFPRDDYEIALDAARRLGNDFFCGLTFPIGADSLTLVLGGWGGAMCGLSCLDGMDAASNETQCFRRFERDRVFHVRLRVAAGRVQAWIDGEPLVDVDVRGRRLSLRPEVEPCRPLGIATYATAATITALAWRPAPRSLSE